MSFFCLDFTPRMAEMKNDWIGVVLTRFAWVVGRILSSVGMLPEVKDENVKPRWNVASAGCCTLAGASNRFGMRLARVECRPWPLDMPCFFAAFHSFSFSRACPCRGVSKALCLPFWYFSLSRHFRLLASSSKYIVINLQSVYERLVASYRVITLSSGFYWVLLGFTGFLIRLFLCIIVLGRKNLATIWSYI